MILKTLVESKNALEGLLKGSLPIDIAWDLKKFIKVINPELASYEEIRIQKVIEMGYEYEDENKKRLHKVKDENMDEFAKQLNELLNKEVEVVVPKIRIDDLKKFKDVNGKNIEISIEHLMILDWIIVD